MTWRPGPMSLRLGLDGGAMISLTSASTQTIARRSRCLLHPNGTVLGRRDPQIDFEIRHPSVSRRHCEIRKERGSWTVSDLESSNGTWVNGQSLPSGGSQRLRNNDVIRLGSPARGDLDGGEVIQPREFVFTTSDGIHSALFRALYIDDDSGLASRMAVSDFVEWNSRRGRTLCLVAIGFENLKSLGALVGREGVSALCRELAEGFVTEMGELSSLCTTVGALSVDPGTFCAAFELADPKVIANALPEWRSRLAQQLRPHPAAGPLDAALITLPPRVSDEHEHRPLSLLENKILQAHLAGGGWTASSPVRPFWVRNAERQFDSAAAQRKSVALLYPKASNARGSQTAISREAIARAVDSLPAGTDLEIAWKDEHFFIAASCGRDALDRWAQALPHVGAITRDGGLDITSWLEARIRELRERRPEAFADSCLPLARMLAEYASHPTDREALAGPALESALRLVAGVLICVLAHEISASSRAGRPLHAEPALSVLRQTLDDPSSAGSYLAIAKAILRAIGADALPARFRDALQRGWLEHASAAVDARNRLSHQILPQQERKAAAERIWKALRELDDALRSPGFRLLHVRESRPVLRRDGSFSLHVEATALVGQTPHPLEAFEANLTPGVWLQLESSRWVPLMPMLVWRRCECNANDLFVGVHPPAGERAFRLVGMHHGDHSWEPRDRIEGTPAFDDLLGRLEERPPMFEEPTGLHERVTSPGAIDTSKL